MKIDETIYQSLQIRKMSDGDDKPKSKNKSKTPQSQNSVKHRSYTESDFLLLGTIHRRKPTSSQKSLLPNNPKIPSFEEYLNAIPSEPSAPPSTPVSSRSSTPNSI